MKLISITKKHKNIFSQFVNAHPHATNMQMWEWTAFRNKLGSTLYHRIGVIEKQKMLLAATYSINRYKFLGNVLYIPHGPIWISQQALELFKKEIVRIAKEHNANLVVCEPRIQIGTEKYDEIQNVGFTHVGESVQPRHTVTIDLDKSEEELLTSFSKSTRYNIRYAEKKNIEIRTYDSSKDIDRIEDFYTLLKQTQGRKYFSIQPIAYFKELWKEFSSDKRAVIQEAWVEDELVASIILLHTDHWASSIFSASSRKHSKTKATYLLRWENILKAQSFGCKIYDFFGATDSTNPKHPFYNTTQFKLGFGRKITSYAGTFELTINPIKYKLWQTFEKIGMVKFYERSYLKEFRKKHADQAKEEKK